MVKPAQKISANSEVKQGRAPCFDKSLRFPRFSKEEKTRKVSTAIGACGEHRIFR